MNNLLKESLGLLKACNTNKTSLFALVLFMLMAACGKMEQGQIETGKPYIGLYQGQDCVVVFDQVTESDIKGHAYLDTGGVAADSINFLAEIGNNGKGHLWTGGEKKALTLSAKDDILKGELRSKEAKTDFSLEMQPLGQFPDKVMYQNTYMDSVYAVTEEPRRVYATNVEGYWTSYPDMNEDFGDTYFRKVKDLATTRKLNLDMDLYYPKERATECSRPLLILIHGGAFYNDDKRTAVGYPEMGRHFASRGFVVASINYRMGFKPVAADVDRAGYRALQDAHAAVCYLIENAEEFGIDTTRIFAAGSSAGAITALNLAFMQEKNRPSSTIAGGTKKWFSSKVGSLTEAINKVASLFGRADLIDSRKLVDDLGLNSDLGPIGTVSGRLDRPFHINAVVNLWGAVHTTEMLKNSMKTAILSIHGDDDHIVPYNYGYPFDEVVDLNLADHCPSWMKSVVESCQTWLSKDKPVNEWVFNPMYGSKAIHDKAVALGMRSKLITCRGGGHSLHKNANRHLTAYYYNTILPNMTRFLCEEAVGGVKVRLVQDRTDRQWFEAAGSDNVAEMHWQVDGGAILSHKGDNKVRVLLFADAPKHSVAVCGKYTNGDEFKETWRE